MLLATSAGCSEADPTIPFAPGETTDPVQPAPGAPGNGAAPDPGTPPPMGAPDASVPGEPPDEPPTMPEEPEEPSEPEFPDPVRIMPLGDSLTVGTAATFSPANTEGGYRILLRELLTDEGYNIDFVGSERNGPAGFDGEFEAENGSSIAMIASRWRAAQPNFEPNVVLLMAGTNDALGVTANQEPEPASVELGELIDEIADDKPNAEIVVAKLIPLVGSGFLVGPENVQRIVTYNGLLDGVVSERQQRGVKVRLADLSGVDGSLLGDGIHPQTMQGYDEMARLWLAPTVEAIEALRPESP